MNQRAEIWNVLHDGGIDQLKGCVPGKLKLRIDIPYLAKKFDETYEAIELTLYDCTVFKMTIWEEEKETTHLQEIEDSSTEILSTESEDCPVHVVTTNGTIDLDYGYHSLKLLDGPEISHEVLCEACDAHWKKEDFEYKPNRSEQDGGHNS